jgi:cell division protein FtsZ
MSNAGSALMGIGYASGEGRALNAARGAISSPLLEASIEGAHGVLLSIAGGSDLGLFEINEAAALVSQAAHAEANIIFGAVIDDALGDEVRVTVIAAGFDGGRPAPMRSESRRRDQAAAQQATAHAPAEPAPARPDVVELPKEPAVASEAARPAGQPGTQPAARPATQPVAQPARREPATAPAGGSTWRPQEPVPPRRTIVFDDNDDLDVPDFLK